MEGLAEYVAMRVDGCLVEYCGKGGKVMSRKLTYLVQLLEVHFTAALKLLKKCKKKNKSARPWTF